MADNAALKQCPFCGQANLTNRLDAVPGHSNVRVIVCTNCRAQGPMLGAFHAEDRWNMRADDRGAAELEAAKSTTRHGRGYSSDVLYDHMRRMWAVQVEENAFLKDTLAALEARTCATCAYYQDNRYCLVSGFARESNAFCSDHQDKEGADASR